MSIKVYNAKKQKIAYTYKKTKDFAARITNNISSISFSGESSNGNFARQLMQLSKLNDNVLELSSFALKDCINLTAIDFSSASCLTSAGNDCFNGCVNVGTISLPTSLKNIGRSCFSNCRNLKALDFGGYECHLDSFQMPVLEYASENMLDGTTNLEQVVFPQSLAQQQSFNENCLKGANAKRVVFLGLASAPWTVSSKFLGLQKDCELYFTSKSNVTSSEDAKYLYLASSNSLTKDTSYTIYQGVASQATAGRIRLRKPNIFTESAVKWCVDPSVRLPTDRIQSTDICPIIVIYLDILTSSTSYSFFSNVLKDSNFTKLLKQKLNCYVYILFRNGDIGCTNSDLAYFKNTLVANKPFAKDFVSVSFFYGDKFSTFTTSTTNASEFVDQLVLYADQTGFSAFNYEIFEIKLEEPYEEEIPIGSSAAQSGYKPWWFNDGNIESISNWDI